MARLPLESAVATLSEPMVIAICFGLLIGALLFALPALCAWSRVRRTKKLLGVLYWRVLLEIDNGRRHG